MQALPLGRPAKSESLSERLFHTLHQDVSRPFLLDIWAPWCAPCRRMEPMLAELEAEYQGRVAVVRLNADEEPETVRSLGVLSVPTLIVVSGGREIARRAGAQSLQCLTTLFEAAEAGTPPPNASLLPQERALRLLAASALFLIGLLSGPAWLLVAISALLFFSAVYDRCPIWRALSPRLASLAQRLRPPHR